MNPKIKRNLRPLKKTSSLAQRGMFLYYTDVRGENMVSIVSEVLSVAKTRI